jgi:hypothetical protein
VAGVSNAFSSALWAIDFLFQLAQAQTVGANFNGGGNAAEGYSPIADDGLGHVVDVRPIFYGVQLFSMMAHGKLMDAKVSMDTSSSAFSAYAVEQGNGQTAVVLNNKDSIHGVNVEVLMTKSYSQIATTLLTAPSLEATDQVTLAGATISPDGSWNPESSIGVSLQDQDPSNGVVSVTVPPASAVLIQTE